ncbi:MAG: DUF2400 family protein, partial [Proteobacteria bacterium]|nr:DUF2400 family protein [Pseudomonadota bacterium]
MADKNSKIKTALETAYREFHSRPHRDQDPLAIVHAFVRPEDQEIVAFIAALLAYGNVTSILSSIRKVLKPMGESPYRFIKEAELSGVWSGFYHRFTTGDDIEIVFLWLKSVLQRSGSIESFFVEENTELPMKSLLSSFVQRLSQQPLPASLRIKAKSRQRNLKYLLSDPLRGSACKRLN